MRRQTESVHSLRKKYQLRKTGEQRLLSSFGLASQNPSPLRTADPEEIFAKKQQVKASIRARAALEVRFSESQLRAGLGRPLSVAHGVPLRYDYQRIRHILQTKKPVRFIYPGLKIPAHSGNLGIFTSSCQATISCVLQVLRNLKKDKKIFLNDGAYWETLSFLKKHDFRFQDGLPKTVAPIIYYDSSSERASSRDLAARDLKGCQILIIDTTCFPLQSPKLERVLRLAQEAGAVSILVRSHMKLDCLGLEYGRLGSFLMLWDKRKTRSHKLALQIWKEFDGTANLYGVPASTSQIYPFLKSAEFYKANLSWLRHIQENNRRLVAELSEDPLLKNGPMILTSFKHDYFFWLSFKKPLSNKKMESLLSDLSRLLAFENIMHKNIASYPWDFLGITNFNVEAEHMSSLQGLPTIRFTMPDFDQDRMDKVAFCFTMWLRKIRGRI